MKKDLFRIFISAIFLLNACATASSPAESAAPSLSPMATQTLLPIRTPTTSITSRPDIIGLTPTFDVSTIVTITPAGKAECPVTDPTVDMDIELNLIHREDLLTVDQKILEFLNAGGSPALILDKITSQYYQRGEANIERRVIEKDVTGDHSPELLIAPDLYIAIYGCENGRYRTLFTQTTESIQELDIRSIKDVNKNGIPEIYIYINECMGNKCNRLMAFEWQGRDFGFIILDSVFIPQNPEHYCDDIHEPFELSFNDVDQDGLEEMILSGQLPIWPDDLLFPYRRETRICKWNGTGFAFFRKEFSEPQYRFQALQDADLAAIQGEYSKALKLYVRTISDESLEWWSRDKRFNDFWIFHANYFHDPTPIPNPGLLPDPAEYPSLAAYAYYRIMLLHIALENEADAEKAYGILQEKFGSDRYAQPYVEMAKAFWEKYRSTYKLYDGCAAAIQYAAEHPEILAPLGSDDHGDQSHTYSPEDVCPFR